MISWPAVKSTKIGAYRKHKNTNHICIYAHFMWKINTNMWKLHKFAQQGALIEQITNHKTHLLIISMTVYRSYAERPRQVPRTTYTSTSTYQLRKLTTDDRRELTTNDQCSGACLNQDGLPCLWDQGWGLRRGTQMRRLCRNCQTSQKLAMMV